jgi:hypothetical protein
MCLTKPIIFTIWSFTEVCQSLNSLYCISPCSSNALSESYNGCVVSEYDPEKLLCLLAVY